MTEFAIRWQNFHGFKDTGWIEFKPLTILVGANNSGKSSLLLPLLLMKQTREGEGTQPDLVTRGRLINAGIFRDLVHNSQESFTFDVRYARPSPRDKQTHVGHHPPGRSKLVFSEAADARSAQLDTYEVYDVFNRRMLRRALTKRNTYSLAGVPREADKEGASPGPGPSSSHADRLLRKLIREQRPERLSFYGGRLYSRALRDVPHSSMDEGADAVQLSDFSAEYIRIVDFASHALHHLLWELHYIGPLRRHPQRLYELSGEPPQDVGLHGENAPELVFRNADDQFIKRLNEWLQRFEFARTILPEPLSAAAFCLNVSLPGGPKSVNFADIGFGMSQVMPLVVQALLAEPHDMMITAQPEIHLNPRLQGVVGDLLVETVNKGARVAVETHSEHLLLRLRRLIAEGRISTDDMALYYVERANGVSHVRRVSIRSDGYIDPKDWPSGFFGEGLSEAMALARAQARGTRG